MLDIIQGKTTVAEASRAFDLPPSEGLAWVEEGKRGMENALRTKPLEVSRSGGGLQPAMWQQFLDLAVELRR